MYVKVLTLEDAPRYRVLILHAYEVAADAFTSTAEERAALPESYWVNRIAAPNGLSLAFGAFESDKLVGTITVEFSAKPKTRHKAHIIGMFVCESVRGLGAGKALLMAALESVRQRSMIRIAQLTVTQGNAAAVRLYESAGFKTYGVEPFAIATSDGFKSKVYMWLATQPVHPV